uniref:Uncharacterized protein n=1 Tax=Alexandrium catenella TaxID=2925 RepID=A0A7S1MC54_ALECA|mmetsp:Transcript_23987/g.65400  ORF Transcript_23987/g.65400 Transcript_23987/m.65400 type:complete len:328 (+) Transcript_23987:83-1066(+)
MQSWPLLLTLVVRCGGLLIQEARWDLGKQEVAGDIAEQPQDDGGALQPGPFKNIVLAVHCRAPSPDAQRAAEVCRARKRLFEPYKKHFARVVYLTEQECPRHPSDVHKCMGELMNKEGAQRDGIVYMHFNAFLSVTHMRGIFDKEMMAAPGEDMRCRLTEKMRLSHCKWERWVPGLAQRYQHAIGRVMQEHQGELELADEQHVWLGRDDLFYIPHKLYYVYKNLTQPFIHYGVHHEITGPTVRRLMEQLTTVEDVNLNCRSQCCERLELAEVSAEDFRCGHRATSKNTTMQDNLIEMVNERQSEEELDGSDEPDWHQLLRVVNVLTQ